MIFSKSFNFHLTENKRTGILRVVRFYAHSGFIYYCDLNSLELFLSILTLEMRGKYLKLKYIFCYIICSNLFLISFLKYFSLDKIHADSNLDNYSVRKPIEIQTHSKFGVFEENGITNYIL